MITKSEQERRFHIVKKKNHPKGGVNKALLVLLFIIILGIYYYIALPAINIHSQGLWKCLIVIPILALIFLLRNSFSFSGDIRRPISFDRPAKSKTAKILLGIAVLLAGVYFIGSLLSSPIINARKYQKLLTVETGEFTEDIAQISYDQIPLLDKDSAELLGDRKMGSLVDLASQFEVSDLYNQINLNGRPVRVTPLEYAGVIKWFINRNNGISA